VHYDCRASVSDANHKKAFHRMEPRGRERHGQAADPGEKAGAIATIMVGAWPPGAPKFVVAGVSPAKSRSCSRHGCLYSQALLYRKPPTRRQKTRLSILLPNTRR
jgi:hypothetical protein